MSEKECLFILGQHATQFAAIALLENSQRSLPALIAEYFRPATVTASRFPATLKVAHGAGLHAAGSGARDARTCPPDRKSESAAAWAASAPGFRQCEALERGEHIMGHHRQPQPRRVGAEAAARHHPRRQFVLQHVLQGLHRSGLFAMPFQQLPGRPVPLVGRNISPRCHRRTTWLVANAPGSPHSVTVPLPPAPPGHLPAIIEHIGAFDLALIVLAISFHSGSPMRWMCVFF